MVAAALIAALSLAAVLFAAGQVVRRYSLSRSSDDLDAARAAFDTLVDTRARFAASQTRLIAELPVFRATLDPASNVGGDAETISVMAEDYCRKLSAGFCIVTDARGRWIGAPGWPAATPQDDVSPLIASARVGQPGRQVLSLAGGLFLVVSEPAMFAEEVLGTITAGYRLDDAVASELALATHSDVNLVCSGGRLCGSSLRSPAREALVPLLGQTAWLEGIGNAPALRKVGRESFVSAVYPLGAPGRAAAGGELLLLRDWAPTERALNDMERWFLLIGAAVLIVTVAGSLVVSRRLTRPLRRLADAADGMADGLWTGRVAADRGPAETRSVATAFNEMAVRLSHWHAEATARAAQLEDAYERFRAVTESANDAIVSIDAEGRIVFWNRRAQEVFGYTEQEAAGRPLASLIVETDSEVRRYLAEAEADARWIGRTVELTGRRQDGTAVPLELSISTWKAADAVFHTAVIRDISERRESQAILREREAQLRQAQKMEAIGRLAGGIAHDFNNLLTAILGYADFLIEDVPPESRGDVEGIRKAGRSAAALTRQLLAFSRRQVLQPEVLDLNAVIASTDKLLRRLIGEDVEIRMALDQTLPAIKADPGQIEQIVLNLAVNARDAMPDGGRLTIATERGGAAAPGAVLIVTDTGCGMTDEVRARIFEPFFTTKAAGKGTGLGLATVYGIVQQSDGRIELQTQPGAGSTFRITFPGVADSVPDAAAPESPARPVRGQEIVLLVEDNELVRDFGREALTRAGYRVLEAVNGEDGLRVASEQGGCFDLVVTDVVMPLMGGRELAARLTAMWPEMRILFTSGYTDDSTLQEQVMTGTSFIHKPFTSESLLRTVRELLDRAPADRRAEAEGQVTP